MEFQSSVLIDKDAEFVPMSIMGVDFTLVCFPIHLKVPLVIADSSQPNSFVAAQNPSARPLMPPSYLLKYLIELSFYPAASPEIIGQE